ncbi:MAG: Ig-like domain-containing protein, partial [Hadesarchaea archaeon]|nr:Ig-like domain-containing protein [Hadesarchaea archaeon]
NITYDATKPTISITAPASGAIIKDSTPLITLTISDAVMGVENKPYDFADNSGYQVLLRRDNDNAVLATLTPITDPTSDPIKSLTFENQWQTDNELPEMWYNIFVQAGDNLQKDNTYSRFKVDVTAPTVPTPATGENPLSGTTVISPNVQKSTTLTLVGTGAEAGTTVKVYLDDGTTASATATVDSTGRWTINISLTAGAITKVEITLTDVAGNESTRYLYGYVMADGNAPTVTLGTLPETTDKSSITISGTITKDAWEDWSDITLTVQVGTGRVTVPIGAGGSYNYSLALSEGPNTIVVQATDGIGNASIAASEVIERVVTPWAIYAIILVIVALILAAIAIFGGPILRKR